MIAATTEPRFPMPEQATRADQLGSGMRRMMLYGKKYGSQGPSQGPSRVPRPCFPTSTRQAPDKCFRRSLLPLADYPAPNYRIRLIFLIESTL